MESEETVKMILACRTVQQAIEKTFLMNELFNNANQKDQPATVYDVPAHWLTSRMGDEEPTA